MTAMLRALFVVHHTRIDTKGTSFSVMGVIKDITCWGIAWTSQCMKFQKVTSIQHFSHLLYCQFNMNANQFSVLGEWYGPCCQEKLDVDVNT